VSEHGWFQFLTRKKTRASFIPSFFSSKQLGRPKVTIFSLEFYFCMARVLVQSSADRRDLASFSKVRNVGRSSGLLHSI